MPSRGPTLETFKRYAGFLRAGSFGRHNFNLLNRLATARLTEPGAAGFKRVYNETLIQGKYSPLAFLEGQIAALRARLQSSPRVAPNLRSEILEGPDGEIVGEDFIIKTSQGQVRAGQDDRSGYVESGHSRFWIVSDGVGGNRGGDVAAGLIVKTMLAALSKGKSLRRAAMLANRAFVDDPAIFSRHQSFFTDKGGGAMAATVTAVELDLRALVLRILNVGDSRAKYATAKEAGLLTLDMNVLTVFARNQGFELKLPLSGQKLLELEQFAITEEITKVGNVVDSLLGAINTRLTRDACGHAVLLQTPDGLMFIKSPQIDLIEIPLEVSLDPTMLDLYTDGAIKGSSEADHTALLRSSTDPLAVGRAIIERADKDSDDNATVAMIRLPYRLRVDRITDLVSEPALIAELETLMKYLKDGKLINGDVMDLADISRIAPQLDLTEIKRELVAYTQNRLRSEPDRPLEDQTIQALKILGVWGEINAGS